MSSRTEQIRTVLEGAFEPTRLHIEDDSMKHAGHAGAKEHGGGHFRVEIASGAFAGKSRLERQRMVNTALKELFGPSIHALTIHACIPEEEKPLKP